MRRSDSQSPLRGFGAGRPRALAPSPARSRAPRPLGPDQPPVLRRETNPPDHFPPLLMPGQRHQLRRRYRYHPAAHLRPDHPFGMPGESEAVRASPSQPLVTAHHPGLIQDRQRDPVGAVPGDKKRPTEQVQPGHPPHRQRKPADALAERPSQTSTGRVAAKTPTGPPSPNITTRLPTPPCSAGAVRAAPDHLQPRHPVRTDAPLAALVQSPKLQSPSTRRMARPDLRRQAGTCVAPTLQWTAPPGAGWRARVIPSASNRFRGRTRRAGALSHRRTGIDISLAMASTPGMADPSIAPHRR